MNNTARFPIAVLLLALVIAPALLEIHAAHAAGPELMIDAGIQGNEPASVGTIENCIAVKKGDRFQMDIVVKDVSNLLAWDIYLDYDPAVLTVVDQDAKMFMQANAGSAVLDLSSRVPDSSGFHELTAVDSADPAAPDNGSGVLARVTFEAAGPGNSEVRFGNRDLDFDGNKDKGTELTDVNAEAIGDTTGDKFFDGTQTNARAVVDGDCPPGSVVAASPGNGGGASSSGDDSSFPLLAVAGGIAAGVVVLGGMGALVLASRRRSRARRQLDA
jgi:hypothetical protein